MAAQIKGWQRISLSRHEYESGEIGVLVGVFHAAYVAKNGPEGMAMFGCWSEDGTRYLVYTTPKAARFIVPILTAYSGKPSQAPEPSALSLLYGDESSQAAFDFEFEA